MNDTMEVTVHMSVEHDGEIPSRWICAVLGHNWDDGTIAFEDCAGNWIAANDADVCQRCHRSEWSTAAERVKYDIEEETWT